MSEAAELGGTITSWFEDLCRQSEPAVALMLEMMRKNGANPTDFVFVVADTTDEAGRFFVDQLLAEPLGPEVPGYVGAAKKADVARVLRLVDADAFAEEAEKPIEPSFLRFLVMARGRMQCADVPRNHGMSRGGDT